jgi:hypothetical protein
VLAQDDLNLAELNAKTSDLNLMVVAAYELNSAVRQMTGQVAGAIQSRSGLRAERVGDELLGG